MLLKLIKYDFKATYIKFLTTFGIFSLVAIIIPLILILVNKDAAMIMSAFCSMLLIGALAIVNLVFLIQFYHKNLYSNEGYLMSTLPTNGYFLMLSKTIVATVWTIIANILECLALYVFCRISILQIPDADKTISDFLSMLNFDIVRSVASFILLMFISTVCTQVVLYFCVSLSNLPVLGKFGTFLGFVAFFVISIIKTNIASLIFNVQPISFSITESYQGSLPGTYVTQILQSTADAISKIPYTQIFDTCSVIELVFAVGFFFLTSYLIGKKISLK